MKNIPDAKTLETILEHVCKKADNACESVDFWIDAENNEGRNGANYPSYHEARLHAEGEKFAYDSMVNALVDLLDAIQTIKNF